MNIETILEQRGKEYGAFAGHARITQGIKNILQAHYNDTHTDEMREAMEMVAHKFGRILNGNSRNLDSWADCIGYLQLVVNSLEGKSNG